DLDIAGIPEALVERGRVQLNGPGAPRKPLFARNAMQNDAQVPVAQAIAEKQEIAAPQLGRKRYRNEIRQIGSRQVIDVVIFGDNVAVLIGSAAEDRAMNLQDHGAPVEREVPVFI